MRSFLALILMAAVFTPALRSQSASALGLKPEQIPADCKSIDGSFPTDIQTSILWDKPDLYKSVIPLPIARNAQSFSCQGEKGTVYSFQFESEAKRKTAAAFIKPLLWGEPAPTAEHPELVLEAGDVLRVVSFRKAPKSLLAALHGSTSHAASSSPSENSSFSVPSFSIPNHGTLRLQMPESWRVETRPLANPPSIYVHFTPASGEAFDVQVTAVWLDADKRARQTADSLKATARRTADEMLPRSVEKTAPLHELRGPQSMGFYYAITDNNPGPGEFTNMTQGLFLTGDVLATFTILYRTPSSPEVDQALRALSEATYVK